MISWLRKIWKAQPPRSWVYDCPNCGAQVQDIVARTDDEWRVWCLTNGGCRDRA